MKNEINIGKSFNNLSEEEMEKLWFDYNTIFKLATYSNPITIANICQVNEGLIHSYPIEKTIEFMKDYFGFSDEQIIGKQSENDVFEILIYVPNIANNIDIVTSAMNACGYYLGAPRKEKQEKNTWVLLQFEPKIQKDISKELRAEETTLLHLTPEYNLKKIVNIGFSPRCKNSLFDFPSRVYFIRGKITREELNILGKQLSNSNQSLGNKGIYALLTIDISKIPNNVCFFSDPNYKYCVYTNSNISPNVIIKAGKITF